MIRVVKKYAVQQLGDSNGCIFSRIFPKKRMSSMPQYSKRAALSVLYSTVLRDEYSYSILESTELSRGFFAHVNEIRHGQ